MTDNRSSITPLLSLAVIIVIAAIPATKAMRRIDSLEKEVAQLRSQVTATGIHIVGPETNGFRNELQLSATAVELLSVNRDERTTNTTRITADGFGQQANEANASFNASAGFRLERPGENITLRPGAALTMRSGEASAGLYAIAGSAHTNNTHGIYGSGLAIEYGGAQGINIANNETMNPKFQIWNRDGEKKTLELRSSDDLLTAAPKQTQKQ